MLLVVGYRVRAAEAKDLDAILEIWLSGVETSLGGPPPTGNDYRSYFASRIDSQSETFKYFVVEDQSGLIVGWQSLSPFRSNPAVHGVMAELSAYSRPNQAPGRPTLMGLEETFRFADASPLRYIVAFIADNNVPALRLAQRLGMEQLGSLPQSPKAPGLPCLAYLVYTCRSPGAEA